MPIIADAEKVRRKAQAAVAAAKSNGFRLTARAQAEKAKVAAKLIDRV